MSASARARRIRGFEERAAFDPSAVHTAPGISRYLMINPTSDETGLLGDLGLLPEDCLKVDCYWNVGDDVHSVQLQTEKYASGRELGIWARRDGGDGYHIDVVVVVAEAQISQALVHRLPSRVRSLLLAQRNLGSSSAVSNDAQQARGAGAAPHGGSLLAVRGACRRWCPGSVPARVAAVRS